MKGLSVGGLLFLVGGLRPPNLALRAAPREETDWDLEHGKRQLEDTSDDY